MNHATKHFHDVDREVQKTELPCLVRLTIKHLQQVLKLCRSVKLVLAIDYSIRSDQENPLSVFGTLQEFIPAAAQNNGYTFPMFRFAGTNGIGEWAFKKRRSLRKHLREAKPIEF
ncbi:MAG: hypothetical protein ABSA83_09420 [Verrucomicrobiota bacterium]